MTESRRLRRDRLRACGLQAAAADGRERARRRTDSDRRHGSPGSFAWGEPGPELELERLVGQGRGLRSGW